jgi:hypothetical protein
VKLIKPSRRLFLAQAAIAAPALITSTQLVEAFWQSRDSNYNQNVVGGGGGPTTLNPSDKNANIALSGGDLIATNSGAAAGSVRSIASYSSGKKYCEVTIGSTNSSSFSRALGIANASASLSAGPGSPDANSGVLYQGSATYFRAAGSGASTGIIYTTTDVVSMAVDFDNSTIWFRRNGGNWNNNVANDPATNTGGIALGISGPYFFLLYAVNTSTPVSTVNFGATAYSFTPPSGFGNW